MGGQKAISAQRLAVPRPSSALYVCLSPSAATEQTSTAFFTLHLFLQSYLTPSNSLKSLKAVSTAWAPDRLPSQLESSPTCMPWVT